MQVFAMRTPRFDPVVQPIVAFATEKDCNDLIKASQTGDVIVFAGTHDEQAAVEDRGRLLGMAEFSRDPIDATAMSGQRWFELEVNGEQRLPKALPLIRAWAFQPKLKLIDALKEQLTFEATAKAIRLAEDDARLVLSLPRIELRVQQISLVGTLLSGPEQLPSNQPTTGPIPADWTGTVTRLATHEAWTYALRFGQRNIWKIGHTQDLSGRLAEINQHVPHEELGERWAVILHQHWGSSVSAYKMEQRMFEALRPYRTDGERVRCSEADMQMAWAQCFSELTARHR